MKKQDPKYTIGLFIDWLDTDYHRKIVEGVNQGAINNNCNLLCFTTGTLNAPYISGKQRNILVDFIESSRLDGIIVTVGSLCNITGDDYLLDILNKYIQIPTVCVMGKLPRYHSVLCDNTTGMKALMDHVISSHAKNKIAFVSGPSGNKDAEERLAVYRKTLENNNIPFNEEYVVFENFTIDAGHRAVKVLLDDRKLDLNFIAAANDLMAIGVWEELQARGIQVPGKVGITGYDDMQVNEYYNLPFTTVKQPFYKIAYSSVDMLLKIIEGHDVPMVTRIDSEMVIRSSCGCFAGIEHESQGFNQAFKIERDKFIKEKKESLTKEILELSGFDKNKEIATFITEKCAALCDCTLKMIEDKDESLFHTQWNTFLFESIDKKIKGTVLETLNLKLRSSFLSLIEKKDVLEFCDSHFQSIQLMISDYYQRQIVLFNMFNEQNILHVDSVEENLAHTFDMDHQLHIIADDFPCLGISSCYISKYENSSFKLSERSRLILTLDDIERRDLPEEGVEFKTTDLLPDGYWPEGKRVSFLVDSLFQADHYIGFILCNLSLDITSIYKRLSNRISVALYSSQVNTRLRERTQELTESNKKLAQLDDLKNDFIAKITHDFRSPLMIILNTADISLKYDDFSDPWQMKKRMTAVYKASLKLKTSIDRLLDLAKMDVQGVKLKVKKINLKSFLENLTDFFLSTIMSTNIKIMNKLPEKEIDNLFTDIDKLEEILNNIIYNAIKFIDPETGMITIILEDIDDRVRITIEDNGIGIPPDKLESIFGRFEQVEDGRNIKYKGTGIGLAFAKELTYYIKGNIWAESEGEGTGAKFIIELKKGKEIFRSDDFYEEEETDTEREKEEQRKKYLSDIIESEIQEKIEYDKGLELILKDLNSDGEFDYKKGIILIVDDNKFIRDIEREYLENAGYKNFIIAKDGKEGVDAAFNYRPDLIICDYNMPNLRGDQFHDILMNNPDFKHFPFIFLTAVSDKKIKFERQKKGAIAYLSKPVDEGDLLATIELHMRKFMEFKEVLQQATMDELTGLSNKRQLMSALNRNILQRTCKHFSIIFVDIDHFKQFNDTYGHQVGDLVLKEVGNVMKASFRGSDMPVRYGGEEFLIIMPEENIDSAIIAAERLRKNIKALRMSHEGKQLTITASFGIASFMDNIEYICDKLEIPSLKSLGELESKDPVKFIELKKKAISIFIKMADDALYQSKRTVCNKCNFVSVKSRLFSDNKCPQCGSDDLTLGRDKISIFKCGYIPGS